MRYYRDLNAEMPCMEYMIVSELATHFFCDPNVENDDIITEFTYLGEYPLTKDSNYVEIHERLVPETIINSITKKEYQAVDKIKQNKIEETYNKMVELERVRENKKKRGK